MEVKNINCDKIKMFEIIHKDKFFNEAIFMFYPSLVELKRENYNLEYIKKNTFYCKESSPGTKFFSEDQFVKEYGKLAENSINNISEMILEKIQKYREISTFR